MDTKLLIIGTGMLTLLACAAYGDAHPTEHLRCEAHHMLVECNRVDCEATCEDRFEKEGIAEASAAKQNAREHCYDNCGARYERSARRIERRSYCGGEETNTCDKTRLQFRLTNAQARHILCGGHCLQRSNRGDFNLDDCNTECDARHSAQVVAIYRQEDCPQPPVNP